MAGAECATAENNPPASVQVRPMATSHKKNVLWHFSLRLLIAFIEALGKSSEDFYVYLPLAVHHTPSQLEPE